MTIDPNRPTKVTDIVGNTDIWNSIQKKISEKTCPHLIICGNAGVGKSTFIQNAIIDSGLTYMIHNCIADSGLRDVRDTIRSFARGSVDRNGFHRWVILEHADSLTADTQAFLRRLLETASGSTRFIFEIREAGAIAEPILSRCLLTNVESPSYIEIRYEILRRTNHEIPIEEAERIALESNGNVRVAVNLALALWKTSVNQANLGSGINNVNAALELSPDDQNSPEFGEWVCRTVKELRKQGCDYRMLLRNKNSDAKSLRILNQWNRPGGSSGRGLLLSALCGKAN